MHHIRGIETEDSGCFREGLFRMHTSNLRSKDCILRSSDPYWLRVFLLQAQAISMSRIRSRVSNRTSPGVVISLPMNWRTVHTSQIKFGQTPFVGKQSPAFFFPSCVETINADAFGMVDCPARSKNTKSSSRKDTFQNQRLSDPVTDFK